MLVSEGGDMILQRLVTNSITSSHVLQLSVTLLALLQEEKLTAVEQ